MKIIPDLQTVQWVLLIISAFFIGASKTGISTLVTFVIPIIASAFGGMASTGIMLPMLVAGDSFALFYYRHNARAKDIIQLLPWTMVGLALGLATGNYINDEQFKSLIAICVLICLCIIIYFEIKKDTIKIPEKTWFYALAGIATGFTSMIGNAAGPLFSVYLLAKGVKKDSYLGNTAWFFFIVNLIKVPLQIFVWTNITGQTLLINLLLVPVIGIGAVFGANVIKRVNEKVFRYITVGVTIIVSISLFI